MDKMKIREVLGIMNYNLSREATGKSDLGTIQENMIDLFFEMPNLSTEQIMSFRSKLYSNPNMFDTKIDYTSVETVMGHFDEKLKEYINMRNIEQGENIRTF